MRIRANPCGNDPVWHENELTAGEKKRTQLFDFPLFDFLYGRFTILDRPSKVQYTWMSLHTRGLESLVTVAFRKKGEDTLLTLRHENLPDDEYGRGHEKGWGLPFEPICGIVFPHNRQS
jgi:hypothetical protein